MLVAVISAKEARNRQKFISIPLKNLNVDIELIFTSPVSRMILKYTDLLLKQHPDVIILIGTGPKQYIIYRLAAWLNIPIVVRLGGNPIDDFCSVAQSYHAKKRYYSWFKTIVHIKIARFMLKRIKYAILVNSDLTNSLRKYLNKSVKTFTIPQYCDGPITTKSYNIGPVLEVSTVTNFLFVEKADGVIWLIDQLVEYARENNLTINYSIAGSGIHLDKVKSHLSGIFVPSTLKINLLGFISDVTELYKRTDVFIYNSYLDATPNAILDSKRFSLPVLVNDCEKFRNIITENVSGLFFADAIQFKQKLNYLVENEELRESLGKGAAIELRNNYSVEIIGDKFKIALENITGKSINL